jgi:hypothetical protein
MPKKTPTTNTVNGATEPEAQLPVVPIEQGQDIQSIIGSAIRQYGVTDKYIDELRNELSGLTIAGINDKDGYEVVRKSIARVRELRTAVEKKRNELNRNAIDYKNGVDTEAKRITALLVEIENPLKEQKEWVDGEKARIKAEEEARKHQVFVTRTTALLERKFSFNGSMYVNGDMHVTSNQVREFSDEQWAEVIARATQIHEAELEAQRKAEVERMAQELERQKQYEEQQRIINEQRAALEAQRLENERLTYENRIQWLQGNGFVKDGEYWGKHGHSIGVDAFIQKAPTEEWRNAVQEVFDRIKATEEALKNPPPQMEAPKPILSAPESKPTPKPQTYEQGFEDCKALVLALFSDGKQRIRPQWISEITQLKPENT